MDTGSFSDNQVIHDESQVKNPDELNVGDIYRVLSRGHEPYEIKLVSLDRVDEGFIEVFEPQPIAVRNIYSKPVKMSHSLRDLGLMPYDEPESIKGKWNSTYWLLQI